MDTIKVYAQDTDERKALVTAATILTAISPKGIRYTVDETYFDYGQRWMWTTLIARRPDGVEYQALCPRDHEKIILSEDILTTIAEIRSGKWWGDK